jgi:hypothetical protein
MLKRSISIDKFVISTTPSSCYRINQNKFIVCVYSLYTSAGIFTDKQKVISSCGWNYCNILSVYGPQTIKTYHQNSDSHGSVYRHLSRQCHLEIRNKLTEFHWQLWWHNKDFYSLIQITDKMFLFQCSAVRIWSCSSPQNGTVEMLQHHKNL